MSNANMPGLPGVAAMTDTLDFVKNLWGGMKIPGMAMPTMSVDELNKQITDLKTVESWLSLNMNMLRGTIQALEVQSATLSTLQSMGQSMGAMVNQASAQAASQPAFQSVFQTAPSTASTAAQGFTAGMQPEKPKENGDDRVGQAAGRSGSESMFSFAPPTAEKPPGPADSAEAEAPATEPNQPGAAAQPGLSLDPAAMVGQLANPAAWWNMLQDQFKQAVSAAVVPAPASVPKKAVAKKAATKTKSRAKPVSRSKSKTVASKAPPTRKRKSPAA